MNLQARIDLMYRLGTYLKNNDKEWQDVKELASQKNGWFVPEFIDLACEKIATNFLDKTLLEQWAAHYHLDDNILAKNVGIVMAGNIPLVGFHDFLAVFISGHRQTIKLSTKDDVLLKHLVKKLYEWDILIQNHISFSEILKGCDAYIATGSNNSARYFEQYFSKYPNIIRRNRTSAAILTGEETAEQLDKLSDDIHQYFGLGCRNVSKLFVPRTYNFVPLIRSFDKYGYFGDHHKYKNNFDYQLSLILLNNIYYMTNSATLLTENEALFSPISHLYYEYYDDVEKIRDRLSGNNDLQCIVDGDSTAFGEAQNPGLFSYADGVDTMQFLLTF
ncbi:MAG: acyl-CoA reductase [Chitinophagaceae bacterium]|nr:MAG: acyl-CoA reductase [Chitinophagaceae bacterium]